MLERGGRWLAVTAVLAAVIGESAARAEDSPNEGPPPTEAPSHGLKSSGLLAGGVVVTSLGLASGIGGGVYMVASAVFSCHGILDCTPPGPLGVGIGAGFFAAGLLSTAGGVAMIVVGAQPNRDSGRAADERARKSSPALSVGFGSGGFVLRAMF